MFQPISPLTTQPVDLGKNPELETAMGKVIYSLAQNALTDSLAAVNYTLRKIEWFKKNGFSTSSKLPANQVHKIVTELNVLSLKAEIETESPATTTEKVKIVLDDFSHFSTEDLNKKEEELQNQLDEIKTKKQFLIEVEAYRQQLDNFSKDMPPELINKEDLCNIFAQKLQNLKLEELTKEAQRQTKILQDNFDSLKNLLNGYRQTIHSLALENKITLTPPMIENEIAHILAEMKSLVSEVFDSTVHFNDSVIKPWNEKLYSQEIKKLETQFQNQSNHSAWENLRVEIRNEIRQAADARFSIKELSKEEHQWIEQKLAMLISDSEIENNFAQKSEEFDKNCICPTRDLLRGHIDEMLNSLKNLRTNEKAVADLSNEYINFLIKEAKDKYHVDVTSDLLSLHLSFIGSAFPSLDLSSPQFSSILQVMRGIMWDADSINAWHRHVYSYTKVQHCLKSPREFIEKVWDKEIGADSKYRQSYVSQLVEGVNQLVRSKQLDANDIKSLEEKITGLRATINQQEIEDLRERLKNNPKVKPEVMEDIMNNWALIGIGIQYNLDVMSEPHKLAIIEAAEKKSEIHETLTHIQKDLEEHKIIPNITVVESKYKKLKGLMGSFPDMTIEQRYKLILNKAKVEQEIAKRKLLKNAPEAETRLLDLLDFNPLPVDFEQAATTKLLKEMLNSENLSSKSEVQLQNEIEEAEVVERLKARGLADPNQIENMRRLIKAIPKLEQDLFKEINQIAENVISIDFLKGLPQAQNRLIQLRKDVAEDVAKTVIGGLLHTYKDDLKKDLNLSPDKFKKYAKVFNVQYFLKPEMKDLIKKSLEEGVEKELKFYKKWFPDIKISSIQGLTNNNEILGDGVCMAKCLRVASFEQKNPDLPITEIGIEKVTSKDRFNQAKYSKVFHDISTFTSKVGEDIKGRATVPEEILSDFGRSKIEWLVSAEAGSGKPIEDISDQFQQFFLYPKLSEQLSISHGVIFINIGGEGWGHALHARVDLDKKIFRFHDPNVGVVEWQLSPDQSNLVGIQKLIDYWRDLIATFYSNIESSQMFQLL